MPACACIFKYFDEIEDISYRSHLFDIE